MFEESVTKRARVREVERAAKQLADSVGKLLTPEQEEESTEDWHFHEGCEHCRRKRDEWRAKAKEKWDYTRQMAQERGAEIDTYARENVWKTVGIAAALGAVVGSLLMKRRQ